MNEKFVIKAHFHPVKMRSITPPFLPVDTSYGTRLSIKNFYAGYEITGDTDSAIETALWLYRHPDSQYVEVYKADDEGAKIFSSYKPMFWAGMKLIGLQRKILSMVEVKLECLKELKSKMNEGQEG